MQLLAMEISYCGMSLLHRYGNHNVSKILLVFIRAEIKTYQKKTNE